MHDDDRTSKDEHRARMNRIADVLRDVLAEIEPGTTLNTRAMFGGMGYYVDGRMFAGYYGQGLALKLHKDDRAALLAVDGAEPGMGQQYVEVPPAMLEDTAALGPWVAKCLVYVRSLPEKKKRK